MPVAARLPAGRPAHTLTRRVTPFCHCVSGDGSPGWKLQTCTRMVPRRISRSLGPLRRRRRHHHHLRPLRRQRVGCRSRSRRSLSRKTPTLRNLRRHLRTGSSSQICRGEILLRRHGRGESYEPVANVRAPWHSNMLVCSIMPPFIHEADYDDLDTDEQRFKFSELFPPFVGSIVECTAVNPMRCC
jgi:hypothetical protein